MTTLTLPVSQESEAPASAALAGKLPTLALTVEREEVGPNLGEMQRRPLKLSGALLAVSSFSKLLRRPKSKARESAPTPTAVHSRRTLPAGIVAEAMRLRNNHSI